MLKGLIPKIFIVGLLLAATVTAYGACFYGWFLPKPLKQPVSIREGSAAQGRTGHPYYFFGRTHSGGGYKGGK